MKGPGAALRLGAAARLAAFALLLLAAPAPGAAQSDDPDVRAREEVEQLRGEAAAGAEARDVLAADDCPAVAFADVMAAPDDLRLNSCYAIQQIGAGDLTGAAATLERLLLLRPTLAEIRLLYAIVLYRLENYDEARREFEAVRAFDLAPTDDARIARYLERIAQQTQRTVQTLSVSLGGHYDTNRNAAPRSEQSLASGAVFDLSQESARTNDDTAVMGVISYDLEHDMGLQREHKAIASVTLLQDDQTEQDNLDLQAAVVEGGFAFDLPDGFTLTPTLGYTSMTLSRQKFYTGVSGAVRVDKVARTGERSPPVDIWLAVERTRERFHNISENTTLIEQDGAFWRGEIGVGRWITPNHRLQISAATRSKDAAVRAESSRALSVELAHTWLLGEGAFLQSTGSWAMRQYRAPDADVVGTQAPQRRREQPGRLRVTYGAPVGLLMDRLGYEAQGPATEAVRAFAESVTMTASVEYLKQQSNIRNYEYENIQGRVLFTRLYEF
ncbi:MAG: tetratricopeptide repeat protein [Marivibrio sp.]|uniref:tetratricopeptide repeat protein n=1 Tax=Marivibrio sp. TaxID=2039719 RepID=UPI0032EE0151